MEIIGYFAAILIGLSLGLIGGGGSILTVPVLVYLFGLSPALATSYSLFVVGSTSLAGAAGSYKRGQVNVKAALLFGLTSVLTVLAVRRLLLPYIPQHIVSIGTFEVTRALLTMVLFAALMVAASLSMIRGGAPHPEGHEKSMNALELAAYGLGIGLVTGLLGAGGGFLLIPVLVVLMRLPMKTAVGTSLLIISMNSLIGFAGDIGRVAIDWRFLFTLSAITISGVLLGGYLGHYIHGAKLKKGFGWFVLIMGVYILIKELWLK
ncbi:MAG: sulfite exporter TauE/SafE family protein [Taibaiella sp.]|nr:sulfite exporter TauE/SafE family protein [Taibaiella sp.]